MKFNLVYGKSGTGKSTYIYENISKKMKDNKIFLIVPEQSNLMTEQNLFMATGENTLMNVEVLTLSRMISRVEDELGGKLETKLSKTGKSMLIYDLLGKYKSKLHFLGKTQKNVDTVGNLITEFKKHNITLQNLKDLNYENKYQELKLQDAIMLYEAYEEKIANKLIDENDKLSILSEKIDKSTLLDNTLIYIDDFQGFTPQELKIVEKIMDKCKELTVCVCLDDINTLTKPENDIFYFNKVFAAKLLELAERKSAEIEKIKLDKNLRAKSEELRFLENNFNKIKSEQYNKKVEDICICLSSDIYSELEDIAKKITKLVELEGYRYKEISIITQNTESYAEDAKAIFNKYNIPIFIDEKKKLNQNVLMQFILSMLEVFQKNWSYDSMFAFIKSDLLNLNEEDVYLLENYCRKWGIKGKKWNKEFSYEAVNDIQEKLENIRKKIVGPLNNFKNNVDSNRTVKQMSRALYNFLVENEIDKVLNEQLEALGNNDIIDEYKTSLNILINILDEMVLIFEDEEISFEKYKDILQIGFDNSKLGKIPLSQDQVILGDTERSRNHKIKVLFIVGMNDGSFPKHSREEGFLNDKDRNFLRENGFSVAKDSMELLYDEQFNIYRTLSMPSEKLFISYCSADSEGKSIRPSITLKKIKRLFPLLEEKSSMFENEYILANEKVTFEESLSKYKDFLEGKKIEDEWIKIICYFYKKNPYQFEKLVSGYFYTNKAEDIKPENIKRMYGNTLNTSVSRLENYRKCPFSFHMTYGLKLKEREDLKINAIDTGSFMHEVIDTFFEKVQKENLDIKKLENEEILKIVNEIIEEILSAARYYIFSSTAKFRMLTRKLKKVVAKSIEYIIYSLKYSDFKPVGNEIEFGKNGIYKPIVMDLENGQKVEITGKIDRMDIGKIDDNKYVRIIDYKSSIKKLDLNQVEAGLQIQLITYLDAVTEQDDYLPSGVLYLGLIDSIKKATRNMTDEEIEIDLKKSFKMQGLVLADVKVIHSMDTKLENGKSSDIIPVYIDKEGEVSLKKSSVATKEEFLNLQRTVKDTIKEISKEILKGKIDIKPYKYKKQTGCDYCKFKTICMFDPSKKDNDFLYI
jgi:ATP-dependent helicase/nuclease subunit B